MVALGATTFVDIILGMILVFLIAVDLLLGIVLGFLMTVHLMTGAMTGDLDHGNAEKEAASPSTPA